MDDPNLDPLLHEQALRGIRRINWWSGSCSKLAAAIVKVAKPLPGETLKVLDLGCASGDVAAGVHKELRRRGFAADLQGWDISPTSVSLATNNHAKTGKSGSISFKLGNALDADVQADQFDVVYCSLFLHHFDQSAASQIIATMRRLARRGWIVDDLIRSALGYWIAQFGCRTLSRSKIVHFDGPQSVRAAFSVEEILKLAKLSDWSDGKDTVVLEKHWPQRYLMRGEIR